MGQCLAASKEAGANGAGRMREAGAAGAAKLREMSGKFGPVSSSGGSSQDLVNSAGGGSASYKGKKKMTKGPSKCEELGIPEDHDETQQVGCYLVFSPASGGVLFAHWSETPVEGAWAFAFPRSNVPKFKFKQNGGKTELIRDIGVNKEKLFNGWSQYIKLAVDNDCALKIFSRDKQEADFWYLSSQERVNKIPTDEWFDSQLIYIVAVIPRSNMSYNGVQNMPDQHFIDTAKSAKGYAWRPNR